MFEKKNFGQKFSKSKKLLVPKKFCNQNNFWSNKLLAQKKLPKKIQIQKSFGIRNILVKRKFVKNKNCAQ